MSDAKGKIERIRVGDKASFEASWSEEDIQKFAELSGDDNPLHVDPGFAKSKGFKGKVVHGMLLASSFSKLVGRYFLGDDNLYLSQTLSFRKPVFSGEKLTVEGVVLSRSESAKTLEISTKIKKENGEEAVSGIAIVKSI